ncbi:MAG: FxsA family protein [Verrucomicrobiota bacterium]
MFGRLFLLFLLVPLAELYLFLQVGKVIGLGTTLLLIVGTAFLGAALTRQQGLQALRRFQDASRTGQLPHREIVDGFLILLAGAVLLTPGFLTDAVGFLLLTPAFRGFLRGRIGHHLQTRVQFAGPRPSPSPTPPPAERVVEGKVIDDS